MAENYGPMLFEMKLAFPPNKVIYYPVRQPKDTVLRRGWTKKQKQMKLQSFFDTPSFSGGFVFFMFELVIVQNDIFLLA